MNFPEKPYLALPEDHAKLALWITLAAMRLRSPEPVPYPALLQHWALPDPRDSLSAEQLQKLDEEDLLATTLSRHFKDLAEEVRSTMVIAMEHLAARHGEEPAVLDGLRALRTQLDVPGYPGLKDVEYRTFEVRFNQLPQVIRERLARRFPPSEESAIKPRYRYLIPLVLPGLFMGLVMGLTVLMGLAGILSGSRDPYNGGELVISSICFTISLAPLFIALGQFVVEVMQARGMSVPYSAPAERLTTGLGFVALSTNPPILTVTEFLPSTVTMRVKTQIRREVISRTRINSRRERVTYRDVPETVGWEVRVRHSDTLLQGFSQDENNKAQAVERSFRHLGARYGLRRTLGLDLEEIDILHEVRTRPDWGPAMAAETPLTGPAVTEPSVVPMRVVALLGALGLSVFVSLLITMVMGVLSLA